MNPRNICDRQNNDAGERVKGIGGQRERQCALGEIPSVRRTNTRSALCPRLPNLASLPCSKNRSMRATAVHVCRTSTVPASSFSDVEVVCMLGSFVGTHYSLEWGVSFIH